MTAQLLFKLLTLGDVAAEGDGTRGGTLPIHQIAVVPRDGAGCTVLAPDSCLPILYYCTSVNDSRGLGHDLVTIDRVRVEPLPYFVVPQDFCAGVTTDFCGSSVPDNDISFNIKHIQPNIGVINHTAPKLAEFIDILFRPLALGDLDHELGVSLGECGGAFCHQLLEALPVLLQFFLNAPLA